MRWFPHACPVCAGTLYDDESDDGRLHCMMCGRSFTPVDPTVVQERRRDEALRWGLSASEK
jgi:hypothetical protein